MCSEKCSPQQPACDSLDETQPLLEAAAHVTWRFGTRPAWVTVVPRSERVIDSCHLLHELAELPAAWVAVTHVLGRCDHGADALPICVLRRAVDLPALLWAGVQSLQNQRESQIVSLKNKYRNWMFVSSAVYPCCHSAESVQVVTADITEDTRYPNISKLIYRTT